MVRGAQRGAWLAAVLCFGSSAMAAELADCGVVTPDAACTQGAKAADGAPLSCDPSCRVPADYSSALSCCGPTLQVQCHLATNTPCDNVCAHSWCLPLSIATAAGIDPGQLAALRDCPVADGQEAAKCVPEALGESLGQVLFKTCTSIAGSEGRCVPSCLNQVADLSKYLPTSPDCLPSETCAPCYDPRTGKATGACSVGCDPGPAQPPVVFEPCCPVGDGGTDGGKTFSGICVPKTLVESVAPGAIPILGGTGCSQANNLCVPASLDTSNVGSFTCFVVGRPDAGADSGTKLDASAGGGSGGKGGSGGQNLDAGTGGTGTKTSKDESSCSCRIGTEEPRGRGTLALALAGLASVVARGRRRGRRSGR